MESDTLLKEPIKEIEKVEEPKEAPLTIPPKALKLMKTLGVDITPLISWAQDITLQVKAQGEALELVGKSIDLKLEPLVKLADQVAAANARAAANPTPQAPAAGSNPADNTGLGKIIGALIQGGGGDNPLQAKMNTFVDRVLDDAISRVGQTSPFEKAFEDEMTKLKAKGLAKLVVGEGP